MLAYFPPDFWPAYLCASVGQRLLGRGSRSWEVRFRPTSRVQAALKMNVDEILLYIPS